LNRFAHFLNGFAHFASDPHFHRFSAARDIKEHNLFQIADADSGVMLWVTGILSILISHR
jgi:hypothetical protein